VKTIKNFLIITIPTLIVLFIILEIFFRYGIKANEFPMHYYDEIDNIYKFDTNYARNGEWAVGKFAQYRGKWHINNMGWNDEIDYITPRDTSKKLIAMFGDSQLEAFMAGLDGNITHFMRDSIGDKYDIYRFGKSGAPFSQYIHMNRYSNKYWEPDILIFLIMHNDFNESIAGIARRTVFNQFSINGNTFEEIPPNHPTNSFLYNAVVKANYYSAFFRYLFYNIKVTKFLVNNQTFQKFQAADVKREFNANIDVNNVKKYQLIHRNSFDFFVEKCKEENPSKKLIFLMNAPQRDIYKGKIKDSSSSVLWLNTMVGEVCQENEVEFIDLTPIMLEDWEKNHIRFNPEVDGHWNSYAHKIASNALLNSINTKVSRSY